MIEVENIDGVKESTLAPSWLIVSKPFSGLCGKVWYGVVWCGIVWFGQAVLGMQVQPQCAQSALCTSNALSNAWNVGHALKCSEVQQLQLAKLLKKERIQIGTFATLKIGLKMRSPIFTYLKIQQRRGHHYHYHHYYCLYHCWQLIETVMLFSQMAVLHQTICGTRHRVTLKWILPPVPVTVPQSTHTPLTVTVTAVVKQITLAVCNVHSAVKKAFST